LAWAGLVGCNRRRRLRLWVSLRICALLRHWLFFCTAALLGWLWLAFAGRSGLRLTTTGTLRRNHHRVSRSHARRHLRRNFKVSHRVAGWSSSTRRRLRVTCFEIPRHGQDGARRMRTNHRQVSWELKSYRSLVLARREVCSGPLPLPHRYGAVKELLVAIAGMTV
jgi:hypothetical protein